MSKFDLVMTVIVCTLITLLLLEILKRITKRFRKISYAIFYMHQEGKKNTTWCFNMCVMNCKEITGNFNLNKQTIMEMERQIGNKFNLRNVRITGMQRV